MIWLQLFRERLPDLITDSQSIVQRWLTIRLLAIIFGPILVLESGILLIRFGSTQEWTGFQGQTLWDWMKLLLVPIILAIGGFLFNRAERRGDRETAENRAQQEALQRYLDHMTELMLDKGLLETATKEGVCDVARARTLTALRALDGERQSILLRFLYESELISKGHVVVSLHGADLSRACLKGIVLSNADLSGVDLSNADLRRANLRGADLRRAKLCKGDLRESDLTNADLRGADLSEADLRKADLSYSDLRRVDPDNATIDGNGANLSRAIIRQAVLRHADMRGANLSRADVRWSDLDEADLRGWVQSKGDPNVCLPGARLHETDLRWASLNGAKLCEAYMSQVDLRKAELFEANLTGATLSEVKLRKANLSKANLSRAQIPHNQLEVSLLWGGTTMPDGTVHPGGNDRSLAWWQRLRCVPKIHHD